MRKNIKNEYNLPKKVLSSGKGITLIALVITIVILIILATVTINFVFGENGLVNMAELARDSYTNDTEYEGELSANVEAYIDEYIAGVNGGSSGEGTEIPTMSISDAKEQTRGMAEKTIVIDEKNNKIMVPKGFKIAGDSGYTVQQGIVIEDVSASQDSEVQGSQFVWIPIGNFKKDNGEEAEIILGRYTFNTSSGTPNIMQAAYTTDNPTNYTNSVLIDSYFIEVAGEHRDGVPSEWTDGLNATAKDLENFIESVRKNGGYYIGRYEASFASGTSMENYKAATKISTKYSEDSMSYTKGTLWNYINQLAASKIAINTYNGTTVESDLINSYAWDTAIVFIQEATGLNYANKKSENSSLLNTGKIGDEVCKINDMSSNLIELTTEYTTYKMENEAGPCCARGAYYYNNTFWTAARHCVGAANREYARIGFRLIVY